ncbi:hypothetical protein HBI56_103800 [Parastagonospora nodorum]|uniref:Uncharacterized protein n=1 Tax=Phaeosphaeria nodorum (strain SN15 / ATCC MYA-4574 / FGSC 10173) TaxID=321614 RepID=A0A7U2I5P1_PHANO|nr:hypothetical protein HBH56_135090 [Parastagonospora nodorum]QRD02614.1 hypothetical protein JI435_418250 [Parastagonospora nodorum SN15]KAH3927121.1 hypothetical protein HBH54_158200 [Parastagonospora nodorum]KAH3949278.1 hypothetical protein HBH53_090180 [Parastagonospora nodorum]KAH3958847.1 hypothetical protein HBH51_205300 [Parastagonospora nodorum]
MRCSPAGSGIRTSTFHVLEYCGCGRAVHNPAGRLRFEAPDFLRIHCGGQDMSRDDCGHAGTTRPPERLLHARHTSYVTVNITSKSLGSSESRPC